MNKREGITLIALVITIIVLLILAGVVINLTINSEGLFSKANNATEQWHNAVESEKATIGDLLNTINSNTEKPNAPKMVTGMTPIKFTEPTEENEGTTVETNANDTNWYHYGEKKWANSKTEDGSMWVWIPRYAYKINNATKTFDVVFLIGTTDTYYDTEGKLQTAKRQTTADEVVDTTTGYTVHPAFTNETSINYANGGWDKELEGIWVSKFEAGYASGNNTAPVKASNVNYSQTTVWANKVETGTGADGVMPARNWLDGEYGSTTTSIKYPTFQGTTYAMNYINHNDSYNIAKALTDSGNIYGLSTDANSHLMKNSEWGAVSYLSQSKYGLNGTNIYINNVNLNSSTTSVYALTGCSGATENAGSNVTTINEINNKTASNVNTWTQIHGQKASSTGTIYGIYDLSGGTYERTSSYVANGNSNLRAYGASIVYNGDTLKTTSTKYTTVYPHDSTSDNTGITSNEANLNTASIANYAKNTQIYGDGIRETSTGGTGATSWYSDYCCFPSLSSPFSIRGGRLWDTSGAGLFSFYRTNGDSTCGNGFRAVVL